MQLRRPRRNELDLLPQVDAVFEGGTAQEDSPFSTEPPYITAVVNAKREIKVAAEKQPKQWLGKCYLGAGEAAQRLEALAAKPEFDSRNPSSVEEGEC